MKCSVQIMYNDDVKKLAKERYPHLYKEVMEHDSYSKSSWYELTKPAYEEYKKLRYMMHRKKLWEPISRLPPVYWGSESRKNY